MAEGQTENRVFWPCRAAILSLDCDLRRGLGRPAPAIKPKVEICGLRWMRAVHVVGVSWRPTRWAERVRPPDEKKRNRAPERWAVARACRHPRLAHFLACRASAYRGFCRGFGTQQIANVNVATRQADVAPRVVAAIEQARAKDFGLGKAARANPGRCATGRLP